MINRPRMEWLTAALLVCLLSACEKIEYEAYCLPALTYTSDKEMSFEVMDMSNESLVERITQEELQPRVGFYRTRTDPPYLMIDRATELHTKEFKVLGPVLKYQSPMFDISPAHALYFYVEMNGEFLWLMSIDLRLLFREHPSENNRLNQEKLSEMGLDKNHYGVQLVCTSADV